MASKKAKRGESVTQEVLITISVVTVAFFVTICYIVHQVFLTRRMRIQYEGGYSEEEIKTFIQEELSSTKGKSK